MSSRLCVYCQTIPLDPELKTLNAAEYHGPITWYLGSFGEVRLRNCPFCNLIASICFEGSTSWSSLIPPADSTRINVNYFMGGFNAGGQSPVGSYVCIAGQLAECKSLCSRAQFPEWIDFHDVHRWISTCEQKHGGGDSPECSPATFNPAVLPRNSKRQLDFRLVDVEAMCIVYAPRQCRYITLSYVWGRRNKNRLVLTSDNEETLMEPGALASSETRISIPNTILDAMSVVRKLRERYLWVDSLCLLQDDANELQDCVVIMDLFYEMAMLTIVAASGDARSGLPGVAPTPRRVNQLVRDIAPGLKMTTILDMDTLLRRSVYSSRAWTMQEEILSNRLLVFINGQVYFKCPKNLYSEALNWPGRALQGFQESASLYYVIFHASCANFRDFSAIITYYLSRNFSFQNDVLRGAQGMLRKFSILSELHCFEGLPPPLDQSLLFNWLPRPISRAFGRREGFPSYSWTGWMYAPGYHRDVERMDGISNDKLVDENRSGPKPGFRGWITWYCRLEDGTLFRIDKTGRLRKSPPPKADDCQSQSRQAFRQIPVSVSDVDFGTARAKSYPPLLFWTICVNLSLKRQSYSGESGVPAGHANFDAIDRYGEKCGTVEVDTIMSETTEGKFALLVANEREFFALMLQWEDEIAERRGAARLSKEVLDICLPPGPRWKAIVLG